MIRARIRQPPTPSRILALHPRCCSPAGSRPRRRTTGSGPCRERTWRPPATAASAEITAANATTLRPVWTFSTGVLAGHEGQPLVVNNTMYVVTPYPNVLYAFDLTREGYPLRWKYRPDVSPNAIGISCCDVVNRGAFYADGKIVYNLLDGHTVAVDAGSGKELWKTRIADLSQGETTPMAPFVVKDRVIVGASGGEFGIYGWVKALDLGDRQGRLDRAQPGPRQRHAGEAGDLQAVLRQGPDLGVKSWAKEAWKTGGAPVWGWISYDPALDLVYYGVGNPAPYNPEQRPGDNKWSSSVLARRPGDGSLVWGYQFTPHDNWDYDAASEMILVDLPIRGQPRKVLVNFNKNGFQYTIDRATGEVLEAPAYSDVTWAKSIDLATGRPVLDSTKLTGASKGNVKGICPSLEGGQEPGVSGGLLSADQAVLQLHQQHVHGVQRGGGGAGGRHAVHRRGHALSGRPRRPSPGRLHGVGRRPGEAGLGGEGAVPRVERRAGDRGRRGLLRHAGRLVQGGRREDRQGAVEVQGGLRRGGQSDHLSRPRREAVRGDLCRHRRRLVPALGRRPVGRSRRRAAAGGFHEGHRAPHQPGRDRSGSSASSGGRQLSDSRHGLAGVLILALWGAASSCAGDQAPTKDQERKQGSTSAAASESHVAAGGIKPPGDTLRNPRKDDKKAVKAGAGLFASMNCDGCHGGGAVGWAAPSLADGRWRYGGADHEIFQSIYYGRPKGMPAFGGALPPDAIWMLVTYLQQLPVPSAVPTQSWEGS